MILSVTRSTKTTRDRTRSRGELWIAIQLQRLHSDALQVDLASPTSLDKSAEQHVEPQPADLDEKVADTTKRRFHIIDVLES